MKNNNLIIQSELSKDLLVIQRDYENYIYLTFFTDVLDESAFNDCVWIALDSMRKKLSIPEEEYMEFFPTLTFNDGTVIHYGIKFPEDVNANWGEEFYHAFAEPDGIDGVIKTMMG